jgi:amino-acid N-acetyltransferase
LQRLTDLREILRYVPHFRDKVFVIALDGAVVADDNFANLLLDIAVLRSLRIGVVLVHGAGLQVERLARASKLSPSNIDGTGVTDVATLDLALTAANRVTHDVLTGLTGVDIRAAASNAVVAHPAGILQGVDHQFTGRIDRVDLGLLQSLLERDIVPVVPPLGWDGEGHTYRLNSDVAAAEMAVALKAVKLIYLSAADGIARDGEPVRQLSVEEAELFLRQHGAGLAVGHRSKLVQAVRSAQGGVPRVHLLDGRIDEGLLTEVFSFQGVGTLVYANEYQAIRPAQKKDARAIHALIQQGVRTEELLARSRSEIEQTISDFYVFEVDRSAAGCVALHVYPDASQAEVACLFVAEPFTNEGIGGKLLRFVEGIARSMGVEQLICLSTQAFNFFGQKGGFHTGTPEDLPATRRDKYERGGRKSVVMLKQLGRPDADGAPRGRAPALADAPSAN